MEKLINIDSTTQFPFVGVVAFFAVLTLLGCLCHYGWKTKGLDIYIGILIIIMGLFLVYMALTDRT